MKPINREYCEPEKWYNAYKDKHQKRHDHYRARIVSDMMAEGFIAPTLNLDEVDERCAMIRHTTQLLEKEIGIAAIQNFAFGGVNTSLLLKKMDDS